MEARFRSWWQKIIRHRVASVLIALFVVLSVLVILGGYKFNWDWTGFNGNNKSGKTLWDWLQLLIIPVVLAIIAIVFNYIQHNNEQATAYDNQRETALQEYLDRVSELLLEDKLPKTLNAVTVLRARTSTALRTLDPIRRANLIRFLSEADLINLGINGDLEEIDLQKVNLAKIKLSKVRLDFANLRGADLSDADLSDANLFETNFNGALLNNALLTRADLRGADLSRTELLEVDLSDANLHGVDLRKSCLLRANLSKANLSYANLSKSLLAGACLDEADLSKADLSKTDLRMANLCGSNLSNANLTGANLREADLTKAQYTDEQLDKAKSLKGAIMHDGSIHP